VKVEFVKHILAEPLQLLALQKKSIIKFIIGKDIGALKKYLKKINIVIALMFIDVV
jgi:hypothetical protein